MHLFWCYTNCIVLCARYFFRYIWTFKYLGYKSTQSIHAQSIQRRGCGALVERLTASPVMHASWEPRWSCRVFQSNILVSLFWMWLGGGQFSLKPVYRRLFCALRRATRCALLYTLKSLGPKQFSHAVGNINLRHCAFDMVYMLMAYTHRFPTFWAITARCRTFLHFPFLPKYIASTCGFWEIITLDDIRSRGLADTMWNLRDQTVWRPLTVSGKYINGYMCVVM